VQSLHYPIENLRSKSWDEFAQSDAPRMDFIITVCDNAAGEVCPVWPGQPFSVHWGFEELAIVKGSDDEKRRAFAKALRHIMDCVQGLVNLPLAILAGETTKREMDNLGMFERAVHKECTEGYLQVDRQ
jgi:arsenate reductase